MAEKLTPKLVWRRHLVTVTIRITVGYVSISPYDSRVLLVPLCRHRPVCLSAFLPVSPPAHPSVCLSTRPSFHPSVRSSFSLSVGPPASIAQLVERPLLEREVVGSNPAAAPYQRCKKMVLAAPLLTLA